MKNIESSFSNTYGKPLGLSRKTVGRSRRLLSPAG